MTRIKLTDEEPYIHPYLAGNFAPVSRELPLTRCSYEGIIPSELAGGQYVRNGGNTIFNEELGRDYHWFDGDGMLSGVLFKKSENGNQRVEPHFVNQFILTDLYLSATSSRTLRSHIVPSISTLVNPARTLLQICLSILRTLFIVLFSHLPGSNHTINRISVANTGLFYHDGRALATCESGPPMRVQLPELETVGWFKGYIAEGEREGAAQNPGFSGKGIKGFMNEWTTGHPKVDPVTGELIMYHCSFTRPYVHYSIIPSGTRPNRKVDLDEDLAMVRVPIPGVSGPRMIHDFGVSRKHTVIMDLPLSLDPFNLLRNKSVVTYDPTTSSRFGVFPRNDPTSIRWFESDPCCIFHTASTWDTIDADGKCVSVNFLACRLTSPVPLFVAGNVHMPKEIQSVQKRPQSWRPRFLSRHDYGEASEQIDYRDFDGDAAAVGLDENGFERASALESATHTNSPDQPNILRKEDECRLFYYQFDMGHVDQNITRYQFSLSSIPFEFPTVHPSKDMSAVRYIYGCSTSTASFSFALGRAVKIDTLVKVDALSLIEQGRQNGYTSCTSCVDRRTVNDIVKDTGENPNDMIKCFKMPHEWYAQEARFVPKVDATSEDDGYLLFYAFDESQLDENGICRDDAISELWILDARAMQDVVCRIRLPQRVPYGFHGGFFTEQQIAEQRPVTSFRRRNEAARGFTNALHDFLIRLVG